MIKLSKAKTSLIVTLVCIFGITTLLTAFLFFPKDTVNAFTSVDDSNAVVVPEIWDNNRQSFNSTNFRTLLSYISSDGTINGVNTTQQTAADIRNYTYGGKASGRAVVVQLGNYQWQVVYLTRTNKTSGDRIATLLMVDNDGTSDYGYTENGTFGPEDFTTGYPTSMYGTSYIRAVTLNNGGPYINITSDSYNPTSVIQSTQSSLHKYALYTVDAQGLTKYLVQPQNVWYQLQPQLLGDDNPRGYTLNNESLSTNITTGWRASTFTYQDREYYTQWGVDYLWLPSMSEIGTGNSSNTNYLGLWELSTTERASASTWWSRSGGYLRANIAGFFYTSGANASDNAVYNSEGVRPALHLNIDATVNSLTNDITVESSNPSQGTVSGGGEYDADYSGTTTITATPMNGYLFDYWQDSSGNKIYQNPYTFPVTKDESYTAYFRECNIVITSSNGGAEITRTYTDPGNVSITYGLTFSANNYISGIIINSGVVQDIGSLSGDLIVDDTCTAMSYRTNTTGSQLILEIFQVNNDITINLIFVDIAQNYTPASGGTSITGVALQVSGGSGATFEAVGEARITGYSQAENITYVHVSAVPSSGYYFVGWQTSDDTDLTDYGSSADIPYELVEGKILTAVFAPTPSNSQTDSTLDNTGTEIG